MRDRKAPMKRLLAVACVVLALTTITMRQFDPGEVQVSYATDSFALRVWWNTRHLGWNSVPYSLPPLDGLECYITPYRNTDFVDRLGGRNDRLYRFAGFVARFDQFPAFEIDLPWWFVSLVFALYPAWRAYRWWRPKALPGKGAFEPVMT